MKNDNEFEVDAKAARKDVIRLGIYAVVIAAGSYWGVGRHVKKFHKDFKKVSKNALTSNDVAVIRELSKWK